MKKTAVLLFILTLLFSSSLFAQDILRMKNGEQIEGYIVEQSERKISYRITDAENSPVIILKTENVEFIEFRNGLVIELPNLVRMNRRFGVKTGLIYGISEEASFFTIGADYFISPGFNLSLNGLIESEGGGGAEIGAKYFFDPYKPRKLKGYTGLLLGATYSNLFLQVPFGVNYVGEKGFDFNAGLRGFYDPSLSSLSLYAEMTFGWRF
jgi:hypothetical protein